MRPCLRAVFDHEDIVGLQISVDAALELGCKGGCRCLGVDSAFEAAAVLVKVRHAIDNLLQTDDK